MWSPSVKIAASTQLQPLTASSCSPSYVSNLYPPGQIRVYRSQLGIVQTYDFNYYVKNVLPNEWLVSWQSPEAFKAGAAAVLDYAWKLINGGGYVSPSGQCADVDDTTNFQVFRPGSAAQATSDAVDTVWEWLTRSAGAIFLSQYHAGCPGDLGNCPTGQSDACGQLHLAPAPGNIMSQYGTLACANQGYTWRQIISTYYLPNYFPSVGFVGIGYGPAVAALTVGNEIDLFVRASDDTVRWNPGIGNPVGWIGWYSLGAPAGGATSDPAVVWWQGNTRLDVFVRGGTINSTTRIRSMVDPSRPGNTWVGTQPPGQRRPLPLVVPDLTCLYVVVTTTCGSGLSTDQFGPAGPQWHQGTHSHPPPVPPGGSRMDDLTSLFVEATTRSGKTPRLEQVVAIGSVFL
jgi:hypothetical protein